MKAKQEATKAKEPELAKLGTYKKKPVQSAADVRRKVEAQKRKAAEEERKRREEEERKRREEEQRLAEAAAAAEAKAEKKMRKEQAKRDKLGVQALLDDQMNEEEKNAAIDELMMLFSAEAHERNEQQRINNQEIAAREQKEAAPIETKKQKAADDWQGDDDDSDLDIFGEDGQVIAPTEKEKKTEKEKEKQEKTNKDAKELESGKDLRSPIVCVLGHVDTGKTSILDHIRQSTVQEREEGGITQQIGASFLTADFIREKTVKFPHKLKFNVPGLLIVDTPGHESFSNLRSRGSSLADITILVVDIMHGVEPQTIESIELLKARHAPFIVALNKIDRLYHWKAEKDRDSRASIEAQSDGTQNDFETKYQQVKQQLGEQGFFTDFWWNVSDITQVVPIVPTSAVTGEGLCDLLAILVQFSQQTMKQRLTYSDETQCTVLEVRKTEGFGYTMDCILVNGKLKRGQKIVIAGQQGPIVSTIRNLLTPQIAKEIREASTADYKRNDELQAAIGCKIAGENLEYAIAGSTVFVCENPDDQEEIDMLKAEVEDELKTEIVKPNSEDGVGVHGNSLGALEALVGYLRSENTKVQREPVNVSMIEVGPVTK